MSKHGYGLSNLDPVRATELGQVHRDLTAHNMRWLHVSKHLGGDDWDYERQRAVGEYIPEALRLTFMMRFIVGDKMDATLVDLGSGPNVYLARSLYTNRRRVKKYIAVDYRRPEPSFKPHFALEVLQGDVTVWDPTYSRVLELLEQPAPDFITSFEVLEHMDKAHGLLFLDNIHRLADLDTIIFFSTPCADGRHFPAEHIYEWGYGELKEELEKRFSIEQHYGTFASQKDIVPLLTPDQRETFARLQEYYDSHYLATILAPLYPHAARNVLWKLRRVI